MEINNWFKNGCHYNDGIALYSKQKGHSVNLVRLFLRKENPNNLEKLKYELSKFKSVSVSEDASVSVPKPIHQIEVHNPVIVSTSAKATLKGFYSLNQLHTDLHPLAIKQRTDFQTAISLKIQLNNLHTSEEGEALKLCLQIEDLFDAIETAQKTLTYYVEHKVVLNIASRNYNDYTGAQLADARRNKRTSVTKYKKKVLEAKNALKQKLPLTEKTTIEIKLQKDKQKLLQHELELQELNDLVNLK